MPHRILAVHNTAAGGDDAVAHVYGGADIVFQRQKALCSVRGKQRGQSLFHFFFNDTVGVEKGQCGCGGNPPSDGGFADSRHTDQNDVPVFGGRAGIGFLPAAPAFLLCVLRHSRLL